MGKDLIDEELTQLTRRGLFLKGGAAAAGFTSRREWTRLRRT